MDAKQQLAKLDELLALPTEHECVEFKHAKDNYDFDKLGRYFSALSNEANLFGQGCSWFVMGVDKLHRVIGTNYKPHPASLQKLKHDVSDHTALGLTFTEIYIVRYGPKKLRVLMFQIPAAPRGIPMSWYGHHYGRDGESLCALRQNEYDTIRAQTAQDWSATTCDATIEDDLDSAAIAKARDGFKSKNPKLAEECDNWPIPTFLNKAKLMRGGKDYLRDTFACGEARKRAPIIAGKSEHLLGQKTR